MAITQQHLTAGVGGAGMGLVGGELARHGVERDMISERQGWLAVGGGSAASLGLVAADLAGVVDLSARQTGLLGGIGVGAPTWYAARGTNLVPRITLDVPDEVNVAGPLTTTVVLSVVGLAAGTAISLVS